MSAAPLNNRNAAKTITRTHWLQVRVSEPEHAEWTALARAQHVSLSDLVRAAIMLVQAKAPPPPT